MHYTSDQKPHCQFTIRKKSGFFGSKKIKLKKIKGARQNRTPFAFVTSIIDLFISVFDNQHYLAS